MTGFWGIVIVDFKERIRRFSFLAMSAIMLAAAFWLVPNPQLGYEILCVDRQTYYQGTNPTWIPMAAALTLATFLPAFGFVFIKNAIDTDRNSRVLSVVCASDVSKVKYMLGKCVSSFMILSLLVIVEMSGTLFMTVIRFPDERCSVWAFVSPFLALFPGLFVISALALLFEVIPWIGRTGGGVLGTILVFIFMIILLTYVTNPEGSAIWKRIDISGLAWLMDSIGADTWRLSGIAHPSISIVDLRPVVPGVKQELFFRGLY